MNPNPFKRDLERFDFGVSKEWKLSKADLKKQYKRLKRFQRISTYGK